MNRLNQQNLRALRLERGQAVRQLARESGIEIGVLNRLETANDPALTGISLAAFLRLADHLAVPLSALVDNGTAETDNPPSGVGHDDQSDVRRLGALLTHLKQDTAAIALADGLGWTKPRLHDAIRTPNTALQPVGMIVFQNNGLVSIRPHDDNHTDAALAIARHPRARKKQQLLSPPRARLLYRAAQQPISPHSLTNRDRANVATLLKAGLLAEDAKRHYVPSAEVKVSLNPPNLT